MWPFTRSAPTGARKEWREVVKEVKKENPTWPLKDVLKEAKKRYHK